MPRLNDPAKAKPRAVARTLRQRIRRGELRAGDRLPSLPKLARDLNVSDWTTRRAVRRLVQEGLIEAVSGRGFRVRSRKTRQAVGVLFGGAMSAVEMSPFHRMTLSATQRELKRRGYRPRVYAPRSPDLSQHAGHERLVRDVKRGLVAGVLTLAWSPAPSREAGLNTQAGLAQLLIDRGVPYTGISSSNRVPAAVGFSQSANVHRLVAHLFAGGVRAVRLMMFSDEAPQAAAQRVGFRQAVTAHGQPFEARDVMITGWPTEREGYTAFTNWWRQRSNDGQRSDARTGDEERPVGMVVLDDVLARGAILGALEMGARIPQRLRLGVLSIKGAGVFSPRPLVRIEVDPDAMAVEAVDRLLGLMRHPADVPAPKMVTCALRDELDEVGDAGDAGVAVAEK